MGRNTIRIGNSPHTFTRLITPTGCPSAVRALPALAIALAERWAGATTRYQSAVWKSELGAERGLEAARETDAPDAGLDL